MEFNIIGAGRLGTSLAFALTRSGLAKLVAVCNKNKANAEQAVQRIGGGFAVATLSELPMAGLTFITTQDDIISSIALQLVKERQVLSGSIVVHCSGVLSSSILAPLQTLGCSLASLHPLRAFKHGELNQEVFKRCDCVIEGDELAVRVLSTLFEPLGARVIPIYADAKTIYHAAAVFASNYLVTLAEIASELLQRASIEAELAQQMIVNLMTSTIANIQKATEIKQALTGPLVRGDLDTISKHLQALNTTPFHAFYRTAALATLPMTELDDALKKTLLTVLSQE